jgi:hypothetical protein
MPFTTKYTIEQIQGVRNALKKRLEDEVKARGIAEVVVRDILPTDDLGVGTNNAWVISIPTGSNNVTITKELPDDMAFGFYGVRFLDPAADVTTIRFKLGQAKIKAVFQVQSALTEEDRTGYFEEVILYKPKDSMVIDVFAGSSGDKKVQLLGFVAERKGRTVVGPVEW